MTKNLGSTHHARWMGSAIYILKMVIFQSYFEQSISITNDILDFSKYIIYIHFPHWFQCTKLADAPFLTLKLYQELKKYTKINEKCANAASKKLDLHTDYLNGRSVVLALASRRVSNKIKEAMAKALFNQVTPKI